MRLTLILLYCFCMYGIPMQAQTDTAGYYHLYLKNGLPSNRIYESNIDAKGFLWISTDNGLVKYNGYTCRVFTAKDGLPTNDVAKIQEDSKGRMWVSTISNDVGYMENDRYHSVFGDKKPRVNLRVSGIAEHRGDIYFDFLPHNDSAAFYRYDQSGRIWEWRYALKKKWELFDKRASEFVHCSEESAYSYDIPFLAGGVTWKKKNNWMLEGGCVVNDDKFNISFRSRSGDIIVLWVSKTTYSYREKKYIKQYTNAAFQKLYYDSWGYSERKPWGAYLFCRDSVFRLDEDTVVIPVAKNDYGSNLALFIENERLQYYGTKSKGLYIHTPRSFHKANAFIPFSQVRQWENEYSGTELLKLNALVQAPGYDLDIVRSYDANTGVLLGTRNLLRSDAPGVLRSVWQDGKWLQKPWLKQYTSLKERDLWRSARYAINTLFGTCAVYRDSFFFFSGSTGFFRVKQQRDSFYLNTINSTRFSYMCYDSSLHLLIAYTDNLLCLYHTENERQVLFKINQLASILPEGLERIYVLGKGRFLVKSHEQLLLYDVFRQRYEALPHFFKLEGSLVTVADGKIFAAGRFGIAVALLDAMTREGNWKLLPNFKGKDYMKVNDLVITDTSVLLGTDEGVVSAGKKELYEAPAFDVDSHFRFFIAGDSVALVRSGDTVAFSQELSKLVLDANNMYGTGTLSFRYRWKGTGNAFVQTTSDVYVGDMKPGHYYPFTFIADDDAWQSRPLTVYLYGMPYWYQTPGWIRAFWIGGVFLFLLFVGGVILLTRYFVERKGVKKQQLIELELRALYSQINPHFIFNSLNSAQYFINARDIDKAYDHVSKFARLLRAYLKSSHDRYVTIAEEVNMLHNYVELQQERFQEPFSYSIKVDNKIPKDSIQIPSLLLQPLVENAINHGLFHKKGQGHLSIEFLQGHGHEEIICIIEDDGIGRERAKEISKANAASRYGSYGTKLTEQLIDIFERYEQMNISVAYTDKKPPQSGTIVTLTIRNVRYVA